jgi:hypothetical protein
MQNAEFEWDDGKALDNPPDFGSSSEPRREKSL